MRKHTRAAGTRSTLSTVVRKPGVVGAPEVARRRIAAPSNAAAWRSIGWFGFAIAFIGLGQLALNFFPNVGFGSPQWEFGMMAQTLAGLPLATMGLAAMAGAAFALGSRRGLIAMSALLVLLGVLALAALGVFWSVVPLAVGSVPSGAAGPIWQTAAKTTLLGAGFAIVYFLIAAAALRHLKRSSREMGT